MASLFESYGLIEPDPVAGPKEPEKRGALGVAKDVGISVLKGAIEVPEAAVGIADLLSGGRAGQALESIGYRPKEAKAMLDEAYTPAQQQAFRNVQAADGLGDTFAAVANNPSVIAHSVLESLPLMGAGGVAARGGMAVVPRMGPVAAGAFGEGATGAGSAAEQIRQETADGRLTGEQARLAATSGVLDSGLALLGGKIAKKLGIADVDTMLAGASSNPAVAKGLTRRVLEGAVSEGVFEELPQSIQEQVLQNIALDRPIDEGVNQAAVLGMLSGAVMGGGANVVHSPPPITGALSRAANAAPPAVAASVGLEPAAAPVAQAPAPAAEPTPAPQNTDPATLLTGGMGADPLQAAMQRDRDEAATEENLANWMGRAQPLALDHAQELKASAAEQGMSMEVVPHSAGQGYTVVPSEWVAPTMRGQTPQEPDAGLLPYDQTPTGVLRADASGTVVPETRAAKINTQQVAAGAAEEAARKAALGLTPDVEAVQAGVKRVPLEPPQESDVVNKKGEPFKNRGAALRAQAAAGAGEVVEVKGGWAVRIPKEVSDVGNAGTAGPVVADDGRQLGHDVGAGGGDSAVQGVDTAGGVAGVPAAPAASSAAGEPVRDAAGEQPTAVEGKRLYRGVKSDGAEPVGGGEFFSPDRTVAEAYAGKNGRVIEADAAFKNLLSAKTWMDAKRQLGLPRSATMADLIRAAATAGHDGLTFTTKNGVEYVKLPADTGVNAAAAEVRPLDHGELNIPGRTDTIDAELDRYKADQKKMQKASAKQRAADRKANKEAAKQRFDELWPAMKEKMGARFGEKNLRDTLDSMVKWEPGRFLALADKFQKEQQEAAAAPASSTPAEAPAATDSAAVPGAAADVSDGPGAVKEPVATNTPAAPAEPADKGEQQVMFKRSDGTSEAMDAAARQVGIQQFIDGVTEKWTNAPEVIVVRNMQDKLVPERVRETDAGQRAQGSKGQVHGFHYQGKVYLVSEALHSADQALTVLAHEALGHFGLRGMFGEALTPIKKQIVAMRRKEVLAKAKAYGLDPTKKEDLLYAAEEVLAEMAQMTPNLGYVRRAVAAIRTWLREHVPGFAKMELTDDEIIRSFILPARGWVVRGRDSGIDEADTTAFSRGDAGNVLPTDRPLRAAIMETMNDTFKAPGKLNWWHKTVGTQYNLAQRSPQFKRVFDSVQDFLNDVSLYATEAADLAPQILPKLESWRDIGKAPISAEDNKAISAPIFEGTLLWARDESGKPIKIDELRAQAVSLNAEAKGQRMLRAGTISENVLKMWQGLPIEQYEAAVSTRYENQMLRPGVVWTDEELRGQFKMADSQVRLYNEFRAAVDRSITNMAISDMVRFGGADVAAVRQEVLGTGDVIAASMVLRDHLLALAEKQPDRNEVLIDTANRMVEKADRARELMERGYAPLSRFGHYTVDVIDEHGERVYFGMFESPREAARMAKKMRQNFPNAEITRGTVSQEEYKLFAGVSPETVELFGELLGLEAQGDDVASKAFQTYIKVAKANRSAMKRLIERKGIAGFSEDAGRVLAGFVYSNARQTSQNLHMGEMTNAASEVSKGEGELKDQATRLVEYVKTPVEEAQGFRGLLFAQYLGGSVASALVNMLQPVQVTFPYLTQFGGAAKAAARMKSAMADVGKKTTGDAQLDAALKKAEEEGIVAPQEVHQLMAQARGRGVLKSGDGTALGDAQAKASNALSRLTLAWGKFFGAAEQFNRRLTFIAAYRTAVEQGIEDPAGFAEKAIAETQFVYNKGNKPEWARGAIGSTLFTFKQYSISYIELLHRMATQNGPEGKRAALVALGMLFLMGGAGGLPFAEDVEDVVDAVMERLGYNFSAKLAKKQFFQNLLGKELGRFAEHGLSGLPGVPIDVSGRLGMGNLIPGTGLLVQKDDHTRDVLEIAGAAGDFGARLFRGGNKVAQGELFEGTKEIVPRAALNATKAAEMYSTGIYKDDKGRKVIDVDGFDALMKATGFQPTDVSRVQEATGLQQRLIAQVKMAETEIADKWAKAVAAGDQDALAAAREELASWNKKNPDTPIKINRSQIAKRVQAMREDKATRIEKTAPKEIRATVRRELEPA